MMQTETSALNLQVPPWMTIWKRFVLQGLDDTSLPVLQNGSCSDLLKV
ncbi:hypothetical protein OKW21_004987 [Catalinimonas alkaloidigena]|nr:hypothetical protein [Catalinimonas alkaloidigena]MDF9799724.1 hypothetical protein [Catalinimonas alkaloidigena]